MSVILFIGVLVFLVVAHELGHFLAAKLFGVRVDEFGVGYPPRAFSLGKWGDTLYTINWLPFGGFVRIFGEQHDVQYSKEHARYAFSHKPKWVQAIILASGVIANILVAWLLFASALLLGTPTVVDEADVSTIPAQLIISSVLEGSPAALVGLQAGDRIVAMRSGDDALTGTITPTAVADFIQAHAGEEVVISYIRDPDIGIVDSPALIPAHGVLSQNPGKPAVGIAMALVGEEQMSVGKALVEGWRLTVATLRDVTVAIGAFLASVVAGTADWTQVAGPVGIATLVGDASSVGFVYLLHFTAFISLNLAVINLIPLPALDGGRIVFTAIEALIRRKIHERTAIALNVIGFTILIALMVVVTYNDIVNLL